MTVGAPAPRAAAGARQAVERLRELGARGELAGWLATDKKSGELLHPEARNLFVSLPSVTPVTSPEEVVELGLWPSLPHNLPRAVAAPRYRVGREVFVRASVGFRQTERHRPVGVFEAGAPLAFTHRAELRGQAGDAMVVAVDGAPTLLRVARAEVLAWNEPTPMPLAGAISGVQIDYTDPLVRAHVCAAYLDLAALAPKLDFNAPEAEAREAQIRLLYRLAARVRLAYAGRGEGYSGPRLGALLSNGQGVCFVQRAAAAALLAPFSRALAFDLQVAVGRTLRLGVPHGFAVVTLRPSLSRHVVDPSWGEPLTDLRVAFFGPGWGHDRRLEGFEGVPDGRVPPEAVDLPEVSAP